jgi:hypothetical protein
MKTFATYLFLFSIVAAPLQAEDLVCATVWACDDSGQVMPQYRSGDCFQVYERQCAGFRGELNAHELQSCRSELEQGQQRSKDLRKRVRRLRKMLNTDKPS